MKRKIWIILSVVFLLLAAAFVARALWGPLHPVERIEESIQVKKDAEAADTSGKKTEENTGTKTSTPKPADTSADTEPEEEAEPYDSPIDFETLWETNEDIIGWLTIEDTNVDLPLLQHPTNDTFYLNHDDEKHYANKGAVYSEASYNASDFSDPVTVFYGHHMGSGAIFGKLQKYFSDPDYFSSHPTFTIYTPTAELTYGVFAAVPYSSQHILYYNDFTDDEVFENFFASVMNTRDLSAQFNSAYAPEVGDKVVILSTCLASNNTNRYLVMAKLISQ